MNTQEKRIMQRLYQYYKGMVFHIQVTGELVIVDPDQPQFIDIDYNVIKISPFQLSDPVPIEELAEEYQKFLAEHNIQYRFSLERSFKIIDLGFKFSIIKDKGSLLIYKTWCWYNFRHREFGPACTSNEKNPWYGGEWWYQNDLRHREDGPAVRVWSGETYHIDKDQWWINGLSMTR